jgi:hypothetical protein
MLIDRDVVSYYPNLMINMGISPASFGDHFIDIYTNILNERVAAKKSGDMVTSDTLKITLNGTFGKTSSKYSRLYSPKLMIQTTLTGQLTLLMLIELLEQVGIPVVSANTDGVVFLCPNRHKKKLGKLIDAWEKRTGLETEETQYSGLYSRDVNNYIAITTDGKVKTKGMFAKAGLMKNPQNEICVEAVAAYLKDGTPVEETITECEDFTKFLTVRTVNGGAEKDGEYLGKSVRWYYANGEDDCIYYKKSGNKVPRSFGAKPQMDLPDEFPMDINYDWYIKEAQEMLMGVAAVPRPYVPKLPRRNTKKWKALHGEGKIVIDRKGEWAWAEGVEHEQTS